MGEERAVVPRARRARLVAKDHKDLRAQGVREVAPKVHRAPKVQRAAKDLKEAKVLRV